MTVGVKEAKLTFFFLFFFLNYRNDSDANQNTFKTFYPVLDTFFFFFKLKNKLHKGHR